MEDDSRALSDPDTALVTGLRAGDDAAFREVVRKYHGGLVRVARGFVGSHAVAEEVAQETWLAVIEGISRFEGRALFRTWLFRILANRARTRGVRESRSIPESALMDDSGPAVPRDRFNGDDHRWPGHWRSAPQRWAAGPEAGLEAKETRAVIDAAIARLPVSQRNVIMLRDVVGLPTEEVCTMLDVTEGNQRVLLHRARSKVRAALESHFTSSEQV